MIRHFSHSDLYLKRWSVLLVCFIVFFGCKEEEKTPAGEFLEVTVKNKDGIFLANMQVYLFKELSGDESMNTPGFAILSEKTNTEGRARIALEGLSEKYKDQPLYVAVVERALDNKYKVLGSNSFSISGQEGTTIMIDLTVTGNKLYYPFGYKTYVFDSQLARSEYMRWKQSQVVSCSGGFRVISDDHDITLVEAMGFGTLLTAYAGEKNYFDGLMEFYDSKCNPTANGLMGWKVTCDDFIDPGSATDGDVDVAFANIVAWSQWEDQAYLNKAKEIINRIKNNLLTDCIVNGKSVKVLHPGYSGIAWGGCDLTNIMYYTPAFFRVFAEVTGDQVWNQLADDTYILLNASANPNTGLIPNWQTADGTPGPGGWEGIFSYDACRAPWRMALDYLWNGNVNAKEWCNKISNWAYEQGAINIVDGYELDGTPTGSYKNSSFVGGFNVALMTNSPDKVDDFATVLEGMNDTYWFNLNTRILYLFTLTGNFWEPLIDK